MDDPIISPWFIYGLSILDSLCVILFVLAGILGLATFFSFMEYTTTYSEERKEDMLRYLKIAGSGTLVCLLLIILIPSKSTAVQMYVASRITPANVEKATNYGEKATDKLIEKILDTVNKYQEKKK